MSAASILCDYPMSYLQIRREVEFMEQRVAYELIIIINEMTLRASHLT